MKTVRPSPESYATRFGVSTQGINRLARNIASAAVRRSAVLVFVLVALMACTTVDEPIENKLAYRSIWSELYPKSLHRELAQDTLQGAFFFAAAAELQTVAEDRWAKFLSAWAPAHGEFEDAIHAHLVTWAELETKRLQYLKQRKQSQMEMVSNKLRKLAAEFE